MAACIPLLKPLADMIFGAECMDGTYARKSRKYILPSKDSRGLHSTTEREPRSPLSNPGGGQNLTNIIRWAAGGSSDGEESILPMAHTYARPGSTHSNLPIANSYLGHGFSRAMTPPVGIARTAEVSVTCGHGFPRTTEVSVSYHPAVATPARTKTM